MKKLIGWLAACALFATPSAWASNGSYSGLYVFGDSLVDSGNAYFGTGGAEASPANGYFLGRFSNGFNFADYLNVMISHTLATPLAAGGRNVAVGGATAQYVPGEESPSFLAQLKLYKDNVGLPIDSNALVLLTFGGNDVRDTILTGGSIDFTPALTDYVKGVNALYLAGARNFLIVGAPDIGLLPVSIYTAGGIPGRLGELTQRSEQISAGLSTITAGLAGVPGVEAKYFDLFGYEHDLLANPTAYGLPATLDSSVPCQTPGTGVPQLAQCANSLYFDGIHPTTQVHKAIATAIAGQLGISAVPEGQVWVLLILGFGGAGAALRRRRALAARLMPAA